MNRKTKWSHRLLALALAAVMCCTYLPVGAFAETPPPQESTVAAEEPQTDETKTDSGQTDASSPDPGAATEESAAPTTDEPAEEKEPYTFDGEIFYADMPDAPTGSYIGSYGLPVATGETKIGLGAWNVDLEQDSYLSAEALDNDGLTMAAPLLDGADYAIVPILAQVEYPADGSALDLILPYGVTLLDYYGAPTENAESLLHNEYSETSAAVLGVYVQADEDFTAQLVYTAPDGSCLTKTLQVTIDRNATAEYPFQYSEIAAFAERPTPAVTSGKITKVAKVNGTWLIWFNGEPAYCCTHGANGQPAGCPTYTYVNTSTVNADQCIPGDHYGNQIRIWGGLNQLSLGDADDLPAVFSADEGEEISLLDFCASIYDDVQMYIIENFPESTAAEIYLASADELLNGVETYASARGYYTYIYNPGRAGWQTVALIGPEIGEEEPEPEPVVQEYYASWEAPAQTASGSFDFSYGVRTDKIQTATLEKVDGATIEIEPTTKSGSIEGGNWSISPAGKQTVTTSGHTADDNYQKNGGDASASWSLHYAVTKTSGTRNGQVGPFTTQEAADAAANSARDAAIAELQGEAQNAVNNAIAAAKAQLGSIQFRYEEITVPYGFGKYWGTNGSSQTISVPANTNNDYVMKNDEWSLQVNLKKTDSETGSQIATDAQYEIYQWDVVTGKYQPTGGYNTYSVQRQGDGSYAVINSAAYATTDSMRHTLYYTQRNAYIDKTYDNEHPKWDFSAETQAIAKTYEVNADEIVAYNKTLTAAGENKNGKGDGWQPTGSANEYQLAEIFSNDTGNIRVQGLPYGTYLVVETTVPHDLFQAEPFIVTVDPEQDNNPWGAMATPKDSVMTGSDSYQKFTVLDEEIEVYLRITKVDEETGKPVLLPDTAFQIYWLDEQGHYRYDSNGNPKLVTMTDTVNGHLTKDVDTFYTNSEGILTLPEKLPLGKYRIVEVTGPNGFYNEWLDSAGYENGILADDADGIYYVDFEITTDRIYAATGDKNENGMDTLVIGENYSNHETLGKLTIRKTGEVLAGWKTEVGALDPWMTGEAEDGNFVYETRPLASAEYTITAAEDIYTQDRQTDNYGNRTLWYAKGDVVAVVTTGDGSADIAAFAPARTKATYDFLSVIHDGTIGEVSVTLPLGSYHIEETKPPYGYIGTPESYDVTFAWDNERNDVVMATSIAKVDGAASSQSFEVVRSKDANADFTEQQTLKFYNDREKAKVGIYKTDLESGKYLAGAVFNLYTADDIYDADGSLVFAAGELVATSPETNADGTTYFDCDIPIRGEQYGSSTHKDAATNSGKYIIEEIRAPLGYYVNEEPMEVTFTYDGQTVRILESTCTDKPTEMWVSKRDLTNDEELPGATLTIQDMDGNIVESWVSTDTPHRVTGLHLGDAYTLTETRPADGYALADEITFRLLQKVDEDGSNLQEAEAYYLTKKSLLFWTWDDWKLLDDATVIMRDDTIKAEFSKKDLTTMEELPGAELTITDKDGKEIDRWVSSDKPHYIEKLPAGDYTLTEVKAPDGYAFAESVPFTALPTGEVQQFEMLDDVIKVEISKKDLTTMEELPGAELTLTDKGGTVVEHWTSTDKPHYIEKLPAGDYTLTEVKAPDGYAFAESVPFTVLPTGEVQRFEMLDDVIKVEISKVDITTNKELPGAELIITNKDGKVVEHWTSTDKPHYIEKLPAGEYTLTEITAPNGYEIAEDIPFTVLPTGEVQRVVMKDAPIPEQPVQPTPPTTPTPTPLIPQTGDTFPLGLLLALAGLSLAGLAALIFKCVHCKAVAQKDDDETE